MCLCTAGPMLAGYPRPFVMPNQRDCMYMLAITCAQCLGQLLLNRGFSLISASRGASINVMQVLFSYLWELTLLGGKLDLIGAIGAASVMLGVIVVASDKPQILFSYMWRLTVLNGTLGLIGAIGAVFVMLGVIVVASDKPKC
eukprot:gene20423-27208_t